MHPPATDAGLGPSAPVLDVALLQVRHLTVSFPSESRRGKPIRAVDDVSFEVGRGRVLGIAGESGSGKSTTAMAVGRLLDPGGGEIMLDGVDLRALTGERLRRSRKDFQFVFQDPYSSLNRRMNLERLIGEPLVAFGVGDREQRRVRIAELMTSVGLPPEWMSRLPSSLSGGQRQRVAIARALAVEPKLLICDEPISALDVSIQAQIVNLLRDLRARHGLTMIFISHDLSMMRYLADEIVVMKRGVLVEQAETLELFANATHPYTRRLLSSIPAARPGRARGVGTTGASGTLQDLAQMHGTRPDRTFEVAPDHFVSSRMWE